MPLIEFEEGQKICGIIGNPLGHSLSPAMHNAAFAELGLDYIYKKLEIAEDELGETLEALKAIDFAGLNVTIPFKIKIMEYLDELSSEVEEIGAVNTIRNDSGKLTGYNTDMNGAVEAIRAGGVVIENFQKKVVIVGAGGAARAAAFGLIKLGMDVIIINRTHDRASTLASRLSEIGNAVALEIDDARDAIEGSGLLINCTSVGMKGGPPGSPVPVELMHKDQILFDMVYSPKLTTFLNAGLAAGAKIIYGYEMFIHQGARAFELWTGKTAPVDLMRKVVIDELH